MLLDSFFQNILFLTLQLFSGM